MLRFIPYRGALQQQASCQARLVAEKSTNKTFQTALI